MNLKDNLKLIGPGLLYAGAAVGVSHLVQSTRAGAQFGYGLIWVIVAAHLVKYPFFYMGPLFARKKGYSVLSGFDKIGSWSLGFFILLSLASMFAVIAAVTVVCAGLAENLFQLGWTVQSWVTLILFLSTLLLLLGSYKALDSLMKWVILLLSLSTLAAFIMSFASSSAEAQVAGQFSWSDSNDLLFLVAFIGWMPAPMDIAIWHSVWQVEKQQNSAENITSNFDFNLGFFGTALLAVLFLSLGANMFHNSGIEVESGGIAFSSQLVNLYSSLLGNWAYWIIAIAAFTTMISTVITCYDAFPRVITEAITLINPKAKSRVFYSISLLILGLGAIWIVFFAMDNMKGMVDFATSVSFLTTPLLAGLIYLSFVKEKVDIPSSLRWWSLASLFVLTGFALFYLYVLYGTTRGLL